MDGEFRVVALADTTSDIANTLFWPTVICLGIRLRPMLLSRVPRA